MTIAATLGARGFRVIVCGPIFFHTRGAPSPARCSPSLVHIAGNPRHPTSVPANRLNLTFTSLLILVSLVSSRSLVCRSMAGRYLWTARVGGCSVRLMVAGLLDLLAVFVLYVTCRVSLPVRFVDVLVCTRVACWLTLVVVSYRIQRCLDSVLQIQDVSSRGSREQRCLAVCHVPSKMPSKECQECFKLLTRSLFLLNSPGCAMFLEIGTHKFASPDAGDNSGYAPRHSQDCGVPRIFMLRHMNLCPNACMLVFWLRLLRVDLGVLFLVEPLHVESNNDNHNSVCLPWVASIKLCMVFVVVGVVFASDER